MTGIQYIIIKLKRLEIFPFSFHVKILHEIEMNVEMTKEQLVEGGRLGLSIRQPSKLWSSPPNCAFPRLFSQGQVWSLVLNEWDTKENIPAVSPAPHSSLILLSFKCNVTEPVLIW